MRKARKVFSSVLVVGIFLSFMATVAGAQETTLEYYSMWNRGEAQQEVLAQVIEDFEVANPDINVEVTWAGRDVLTKARSRILMGNPPDLMDQAFYSLYAALLADGESALPVDDLLDSEGPEGQASFRSLFHEELLDLYAKDGSVYFVPYEFITSGFFYNKTMFEEYGFDVPQTWDELMSIAEKLQADGIAPFAQDGTQTGYNAYWYTWLCNRVLGKGALLAAASDSTGSKWDDPGFLQAATLLSGISKAGEHYFLEGYEGSVWPAAQISWANEDAAMILCGAWIPAETADARQDKFEVDFFPFPMVSGGKGDSTSVEGYLIGFTIPEKAAEAEAAKQFIKFTLREEYQAMIATVANNMPGRNDVAYPAELSSIAPYVENAGGFHMRHDGTSDRQAEWFNNVFGPLSNQLLYGDITPEQFISRMKANTISYWAK